MENVFYRSPWPSACADVIPFYDEGEFKLFYLRDLRNGEHGCPWHLLTTPDLVHYTEHGEVLPRGEPDQQDLWVFTGCCIKHGGEYCIFYTGHNGFFENLGWTAQKILLAKSRDLLHWEKVRDFALEPPTWLSNADFRDPFVFYDEEKGKYAMLVTSRLADGETQLPRQYRGVTAIAYSDDLLHWDFMREPFYAPAAYHAPECSDLFRMGDWWYLVFSEFTDKINTTYRMSKSLAGPWAAPKHNSFDGHAFYAAKSASDGRRRVMFGWNCTKVNETDANPWEWGGHIVAHELWQDTDGALYVKCPEALKAHFSHPLSFELAYQFGAVKGDLLGDSSCQGVKLFTGMPETCRLDLRFTTTGDAGEFGVILRESENMAQYYAVKFEPKHNRLAFERWPRRENTVHTQVDVERWCPLAPDVENHLTIIVQQSVLEVYVNDRVAMSARMFDHRGGGFGLYARWTAVEFGQPELYA